MSYTNYKPQIDLRIMAVLKTSELKVYMYLRSKSSTWMFYVSDIAEKCGVCAKTVIRATSSLIKKGFATRERVRLSKGVFGGFFYQAFSVDESRSLQQKTKIQIRKLRDKAKGLALKKLEELQAYALKNPLISKDFTTGTFFPPNKTKEEFYFNKCKTHTITPLKPEKDVDWLDNLPNWSDIVKKRGIKG